jgi:hypothetical protein
MSSVRIGLAVVGAALVALATGCSSSSSSADKSADSGKPAAAADGCPANATKNTDGGFCIVLPSGVKGDPPVNNDANTVDYTFGDGTGKFLNVETYELNKNPGHSWDFETKARSYTSDGTAESGDLPGGLKYFQFKQGESTRYTVLTHKGDKLLECSTRGNPPVQAFVDACKTMRQL